MTRMKYAKDLVVGDKIVYSNHGNPAIDVEVIEHTETTQTFEQKFFFVRIVDMTGRVRELRWKPNATVRMAS